MVWTKAKSDEFRTKLRDITNSIEQLNRGMYQLENQYQTILSTSGFMLRYMRGEANYLTAMNDSTADEIKSSLEKIEAMFSNEMKGAPDETYLIEAFIKVLQNSLRVLHEYKLTKQKYADKVNKRFSNSPSLYNAPSRPLYSNQSNRSSVRRNLLSRLTNFFGCNSCK